MSRVAKRIPREEFSERATTLYIESGYSIELDLEYEDENDKFDLDGFLETQIVKDDFNDFMFGTENQVVNAKYSSSIFPKSGSLLGYQQLDNGLQFVGFAVSRDIDLDIFVIIYWDGQSFRGYVPVSGNTLNTIFMCAFGSEMYSKYGPNGELSHLGYDIKYKGLSDFEISRQCLTDLGYCQDGHNPLINWKLIEEDIKRNINVI